MSIFEVVQTRNKTSFVLCINGILVFWIAVRSCGLKIIVIHCEVILAEFKQIIAELIFFQKSYRLLKFSFSIYETVRAFLMLVYFREYIAIC